MALALAMVRRNDLIPKTFDTFTEALLNAAPTLRVAEIVHLETKELLAHARIDRAEWVVTAVGKKLIAEEVYGSVA